MTRGVSLERASDMYSAFLTPRTATGTKFKQLEKAKETQKIVEDRAFRSGAEAPPYEFLELIGKGSFGRVFKCKHRRTQEIVAVKITEVDSTDYKEYFEDKDRSLPDLIKEINVLQQLKESRARHYVNIIYEAFSMYSELWIVSEYCPGGSVLTLMKPTPKGLSESYIIAIARELATALKFVHEAGVLHRDVKCGNVLVTEDGRVQLCDFGVSGVLETEIAKRSTIVGTPFWMAPELQKEMNEQNNPVPILYGSEVDIWAFGCTVHEMATGTPPLPKVRGPIHKIAASYRGAPRLEGDDYSEELKDLVAFCLEEDPRDRPSAERILQHPYITNTSQDYPTSSLKELIERYAVWEQSGGQRLSLFNAMGAQGPEPMEPAGADDDDWNFSMSDELDRRLSRNFRPSTSFGERQSDRDFNDMSSNRFGANFRNLQKEEQIRRGEEGLNRLFDTQTTPYSYGSDLALRREYDTGSANNRVTMIDLDAVEPITGDVPNLDLAEVPTIKARGMNRLLREMQEEEEDERAEREKQTELQTAKRATRDWKFPAMGGGSERPNRKTQEWSFASAMQEASESHGPILQGNRISTRRTTKDLNLPLLSAPLEEPRDRKTRDFVFPSWDAQDGKTSDNGPEITFNHIPEEGSYNSAAQMNRNFNSFFYGQPQSAPESPLRTSMIDLDFANATELRRPSTAGSESEMALSAVSETTNGDPFDLEDQVQLSQRNNRGSFHTKSQSEPFQNRSSMLTPSDLDGADRGFLHARGVSQVTTASAGPPTTAASKIGSRIPTARRRRDYHTPQMSMDSSVSVETASEPGTEDERDGFYLSAWKSGGNKSHDLLVPRLPPYDDDLPSLHTLATSAHTAPPRPGLRAPPLPSGARRVVDFPLPAGPDPDALMGGDPDALGAELRRLGAALVAGMQLCRDVVAASITPVPSEAEWETTEGEESGGESGGGSETF